MTSTRALLIVVLAALSMGVLATRAPAAPSHGAHPAGTVRVAKRLLAGALARANGQQACAGSRAEVPVPLADAPDPALLALVAPLRRAATAADALSFPVAPPFANLYPGSTRNVTAADGTAITLAVGRLPSAGPTEECLQLQRQQAARAARHRSRAVRRVMTRILKRQQRRSVLAVPTNDRVLAFLTATGAPLGGSDIDGFTSVGSLSMGISATQTRIVVVVPDGVARVSFTGPITAERGFPAPPAVATPIIVDVHDNVVSLTLDGAVSPAFVQHVTWLDGAGTEIKRIG
ncbi:MAG TPA: hypothetical protein VFT50_04030 [Baekduia sp.]|nr:hypothetical protein [Baekduia sp.]